MMLQIDTDSDAWPKIRKAILASGYRIILQTETPNSDSQMTLELVDPEEPEMGHLNRGLIVYAGGKSLCGVDY